MFCYVADVFVSCIFSRDLFYYRILSMLNAANQSLISNIQGYSLRKAVNSNNDFIVYKFILRLSNSTDNSEYEDIINKISAG